MSYRQSHKLLSGSIQFTKITTNIWNMITAFLSSSSSVANDLQILGAWYARQGFAEDNHRWKLHSLNKN